MKTIFSNEKTAEAMAHYCKRATFENAYKYAHGETEKDRENMAYLILAGFADIEKYLAGMGYTPR